MKTLKLLAIQLLGGCMIVFFAALVLDPNKLSYYEAVTVALWAFGLGSLIAGQHYRE